MTCPNVVRFPRGALAVLFGCRIDNVALGATAGSFSYSMRALTNIPSVRVTPLPPTADIGCVPLPPLPPGGPVNCGVAPNIPIAGAGPVGLLFRANRLGVLPSQWTYSAIAEDPPAVITPKGVTVGFGASTGSVSFVEVEVLPEAVLETGAGEVIVRLKARDPAVKEEIRVPVRPGETFGGLPYEALLESGSGPIRLPGLQ